MQELPAPSVSAATYAYEASELLVRRGHVGPELFDVLAGALPARRAEVEALRAAFGVGGTTRPDRGARVGAAASTALARELGVLRTRVRGFWIEGVLAQSRGAHPELEPPKQTVPGAVSHAWEALLQVREEEPRVLPPETRLLDVYDELEGAVLVLGQPGSGKTTALLTLAEGLLDRADLDEDAPVPVVLLLASWAGEELGAWLERELGAKYRIPVETARRWLGENRLVLMLDGLDEVEGERRGACVAAVNRYLGARGAGGVVLSCRADEYRDIGLRLDLRGAVLLQPLSDVQIDEYLARAGAALAGLRAAVGADVELAELARSPLMLRVMERAWAGVPAADLASTEGLAARRRQLLGTYVERCFGGGDGRERALLQARLGWLARGLGRANTSIFLLEDLQRSWLGDRRARVLHVFGMVLLMGLGAALPTDLAWAGLAGTSEGVAAGRSALPAAWLYGAMVGWMGLLALAERLLPRRPADPRLAFVVDLGFGAAAWAAVMVGLELSGGWRFDGAAAMAMLRGQAGGDVAAEESLNILLSTGSVAAIGYALVARRGPMFHGIRPVEQLVFSPRGAAVGAGWGALLTALAGPVFLLRFSQDGYGFRWGGVGGQAYFGVIIVALGAAMGVVLGGLRRAPIEARVRPNTGITRSAQNGLLAAGVAALSVGLVFGLTLAATDLDGKPVREMVAAMASLTLLLAYGAAVVTGGSAFLAHWLLRLLLAASGELPLEPTRELDRAVRRGLLRRAGAGWIFFHRTLQEHFAAQPPG